MSKMIKIVRQRRVRRRFPNVAGRRNALVNEQMPSPLQSAAWYGGPVLPPAARSGNDTHVLSITDELAAASNGSGVMAYTFTNDPNNTTGSGSATTPALWSSLQNVFAEYRVLAVQLTYTPVGQSTQPLNTSPGSSYDQTGVIAVAIDRTSSAGTAPTSYTTTTQLAGAFEKCNNQPIRCTARMDGFREAVFTNIASSPLGLFAIKFYGSGMQAGVTYGRFMIRYLVQFRQASG
jgi:hypothetical protein